MNHIDHSKINNYEGEFRARESDLIFAALNYHTGYNGARDLIESSQVYQHIKNDDLTTLDQRSYFDLLCLLASTEVLLTKDKDAKVIMPEFERVGAQILGYGNSNGQTTQISDEDIKEVYAKQTRRLAQFLINYVTQKDVVLDQKQKMQIFQICSYFKNFIKANNLDSSGNFLALVGYEDKNGGIIKKISIFVPIPNKKLFEICYCGAVNEFWYDPNASIEVINNLNGMFESPVMAKSKMSLKTKGFEDIDIIVYSNKDSFEEIVSMFKNCFEKEDCDWLLQKPPKKFRQFYIKPIGEHTIENAGQEVFLKFEKMFGGIPTNRPKTVF